MTFLGVYFITSGRVRADHESSFSSEDEEGSIGLLNGERYHDRIDLSPPGHQLPKTSDVSTEAQYDVPQSPRGSILSQGTDGDDDQSTPRGVLSAAPSSPRGSLTDASPLSAPSFDYTSPLRPPSRMSNPWEDIQDQAVVTPQSDIRPVTPPGQEDEAAQASTVLLRFPPAPGLEEATGANGNAGTARRASTPTLIDQASHPIHNEAPLETPSRRTLRSSISRFSPGPLLPTLSGGFTAIVADSIRRGDGSPLKDRTRRRLGRRRQLDGAFADPSLEGNSDAALSLATARLQSATNLADRPAEAGRSTPALATEINTIPTQPTNENSTRLRSLSDSWSGGLAWLGGALRKPQNTKTADNVAVTGTPTPDNETRLEPSYNTGDSDTETEARR